MYIDTININNSCISKYFKCNKVIILQPYKGGQEVTTSSREELKEYLKKYISHSDGFGAFIIEEDKMDKFEAGLFDLITKHEVEARIDELKNLLIENLSQYHKLPKYIGSKDHYQIEDRLSELQKGIEQEES